MIDKSGELKGTEAELLLLKMILLGRDTINERLQEGSSHKHAHTIGGSKAAMPLCYDDLAIPLDKKCYHTHLKQCLKSISQVLIGVFSRDEIKARRKVYFILASIWDLLT